MFIQKLFPPKWKHKNPNIRKQALEALNPVKEDTQKIFAEVINTDNDLSVRRLVVGRLRDIGLLQTLQQTQDQLGDSAAKRIRQLIAGNAQYPIDYPSRKCSFENTDEQAIAEYVAREAKEAELRLIAVDKIQRQSLLGDLAADDVDAEVRLKALDKISQISTLDRVYKKSRLKDKRISALAKERLDTLTAELERPKVLKKDAKKCCTDLESLVQRCKKSGQWLSAKPRFDVLQTTWQSVQDQWQSAYGEWDESLTANFNQLSREFDERFQHKHQEEAEKRALEEKTEPFKAQKRKASEELQSRLAELKQLISPTEQQFEELNRFLEANDQLWRSAREALSKPLSRTSSKPSPSSPLNVGVAEDHQEIDHLYSRLRGEVNEYKNDLQAHLALHRKLNELLDKANSIAVMEEPLDAAVVSVLQTAFDKLAMPKYFLPDEALLGQLKQKLAALAKRVEQEQKQAQANIEAFAALVTELSAALKGGKTKHAVNLANRGRKLLTAIAPGDRRKLQKNKHLKQFNESLKQLNDLQSWRQWSNAPVKEQLCEQMQQLAQQVEENQDNPEFDFQDTAQRVKDARGEWKKLTAAEPSQSNELWEVFDAACTKAYEPCQRYFDQQTQVRIENLKKREAACASLEDYYEVLSHKPTDLVDWKALDKIVRVAQEEWRLLGAVERKDRAPLNKRFRDVINALRKLRGDQKDRNKEEKAMLIKRAEAVTLKLEEEKISLREAIDSIKQLQTDWKAVGLATGDGALWKAFRSSCDAVFKQREQETAAAREQRQKLLDSRTAVCEAIENLTQLSDEALKAAQKDFEELKQQWVALPDLPKSGALHKRFNDACRAFETQNKQRIERENQQRRQTQRRQGDICRQSEKILFDCLQHTIPVEKGLQEITDLEMQWQQLPVYSHPVSKALLQRFAEVKGLLGKISETDIESVADQIRRQEPSRVSTKELLCLQMEILANVESPAEAQQARMQYQVSQLADKMKQNAPHNITSEAEELQSRWQLSGVVRWELSEALENRFYRAYDAVKAD